MENNKKRNKIINAILIVVYVLTIGIILFLTKSNIFNDNEPEEETPVTPNSTFEKVSIKDLETKLNKLSFVNKKQDYVKDNSFITLTSNIEDGKVVITLKMKANKREYTVPEIEDAKCIGSYLILEGSGTHVSYVLTESGKVYIIEDDLKTANEDEKYVGKAVDLGLTDITSIAVNHKLNFSLLEDKTKVKPFVYAKMEDGRVFSDEDFIEGKEIVELVEEKQEEVKEETKENTSTN